MSNVVDQIKALEELSALDASLKTLSEQLSVEKKTLGDLESSLATLDAKTESTKKVITEKEKGRNAALQDVRSMQSQLEHSREKLNRSRTERETNAVQRELEELRRLVRDREHEVEGLTRDAEALKVDNTTTEAEATAVRAKLDACKDDIRAKVGTLEADHQGQGTGREAIVKRIPPQLYRRYEMVRKNRGYAVATTTTGTCKACNMSLPPQLFHRLQREPLIEHCPSCNRIIFFTVQALQTQED